MTRDEILNATDEEILEEVTRLQYLFGHSKIIRHGLNRDSEEYVTQSVAEHIYNMMTLAEYFRPLEDPDNQWDWEKIHRMILWHDATELETGDLKKHEKTEETEKEEKLALPRMLAQAPLLLLQDMQSIVDEYETRITTEARFVKALDALEAMISSYEGSCKKRYIMATGNSKKVHEYYKKLQVNNTEGFLVMQHIAVRLFATMDKLQYFG